jgi:FtsP/CotA-like multicopper oxidase with cupredoxin domain
VLIIPNNFSYYHQEYFTLIEQVMAPASEGLLPPVSNNNLINGKMNYPCASAAGLPCTANAGISKFYFESGKTYRLRLINGGAEGIQKFSIDGYKLTVFANDFVPVVPYEVDVVTLGIGQRTDVIVKATGKPTDTVWMRSTLGKSAFDGGCTLNDGISPEAVAAIYYEKANTSAIPTTTSSVPDSGIELCANDALTSTVPYFSLTPPPKPETTQEVSITYQSNGTHNLFYMNNSTFRADYNDPLLLEAKLGHTTFPAESNVYNFGDSKSVRLVVYNYASTGVHPMHMHGHNMYVLATGTGTWDGTITNGQNPQRRDVQLLPSAVTDTEPGYIVIQIDADNPGVWPFHCHIAWHVSAGLYINLLESPDKIKKDMQIPSISAQTCRDWAAWTGGHIPDEIDSGL